MAKVVVLGAGVSGHTAAAFLKKWVGHRHSVTVVSPEPTYNWIPSNIWVGVGLLKKEKVVFPLAPVYKRHGIEFIQARAKTLYPEGKGESKQPVVEVERTDQGHKGEIQDVSYDYLVNATGPKLNFAATEGLGPDGHSLSVCTADHAEHTAAVFLEKVDRMRKGEKQTFLVGTGHGEATCEGAAFEYVVNLEFELRARKVREKAEIIYLTNEYELGDFGVDGVHIKMGGYVTPSKIFAESLFAERAIDFITKAHVRRVEEGAAIVETLEGRVQEVRFDMAMLIPPFSGVGLQAFKPDGTNMTDQVFAPNGFMKVDADYTKKPYEEWKPSDWPRFYQNPTYKNLFAAGIAFAPPHPISRPRQTESGRVISPAAPRTGMPSAVIGKAVAKNIVSLIKGDPEPMHSASLADMGAACVASAGANPFTGTAASITVYPVIPDWDKYPEYGRDLRYTCGEIGVAGHWIKILLHHMFLYKARLHPGWSLIPE